LNNPTARIEYIAASPSVSIEITTSTEAQTASMANVLPGFGLPRLKAM
jgi:hypothetical protein